MAATIADVAMRAGVSTATVSRVLSGVGRARPETRERVLTAARDLAYRPSSIARSLKLRSTRTLGLIVTDIENPFFPELVRAVEDAARDRGYALLLCNAADDPEREAGYLQLLVDRRVDGVLIAASSLGERHGAWLAHPPLPVVLVNCTAPRVRLPAVMSNNRAGGRIAVEHLLGLGHRRIGHITAPSWHVAADARLEGGRDAMRDAGLDPGALVVVAGDAYVVGGERAMRELLQQQPEVTAVYAYNDLMTIGALRAVRATGRRVPDDLSLVGFDDVEVARYTDPPLTTIVQQTRRMGALAVERLIALLVADPGPTPAALRETLILDVCLEVRGSTGPVPR